MLAKLFKESPAMYGAVPPSDVEDQQGSDYGDHDEYRHEEDVPLLSSKSIRRPSWLPLLVCICISLTGLALKLSFYLYSSSDEVSLCLRLSKSWIHADMIRLLRLPLSTCSPTGPQPLMNICTRLKRQAVDPSACTRFNGRTSQVTKRRHTSVTFKASASRVRATSNLDRQRSNTGLWVMQMKKGRVSQNLINLPQMHSKHASAIQILTSRLILWASRTSVNIGVKSLGCMAVLLRYPSTMLCRLKRELPYFGSRLGLAT